MTIHQLSSTRKPPSRYIVAAIFFLIISSAVVSIIFGRGENAQLFAAFGAAKRILLPLGYIVFGVVLLLTYKKRMRENSYPLWWYSLIAITILSTLSSAFLPRQDVEILNLLQGAALTLGWALIACTGLLARNWQSQTQWYLVVLLGMVALATNLFSIRLGAFVSFSVPVAAGLLYAAFRLKKGRIFFLFSGLFLSISLAYSAIVEGAVSASVIGQSAGCFFLLILAIIPRVFRGVLTVLGGVLVLYVLASQKIIGLMFGNTSPGIEDVTLTHRAYEANAVIEIVDGSLWSWLVGVGPAATVDLSRSPDSETLIAAGRLVDAVDDVHFLTSWVLLKFGLFGLAWLVAFMYAMIVQAKHLLSMSRPKTFELFLLMFVVGGVVASIPAATNFFANPLVPLFFGVLTARRQEWIETNTTGRNSHGSPNLPIERCQDPVRLVRTAPQSEV